MKKILAVLILITPLLIVIVLDIHVGKLNIWGDVIYNSGLVIFEDGSFILENISGCIPFNLCQ